MTEYYTFCWNGHTNNGKPWYRCVFTTTTGLFNSVSTNKYALMFTRKDRDVPIRDLVHDRIADELFGTPRFFMQAQHSTGGRSPYTLVSGSPRFSIRLLRAERGTTLGFLDKKGELHNLPFDHLYRTCHRLEKFSMDCEHCPLDPVSGPGDCVEAAVKRWCEENNFDPNLSVPTEDHADSMDPEELESYLKLSENNVYTFASPRVTRDDLVCPPGDKVQLVRHWSEHYLHDIEDNHRKASDRSKKAAVSRAAHRVCDASCYYATDCKRRYDSYRSRALECQQPRRGDNWWKSTHHVPGPYPEQEVHEIYRQWVGKLSEEEVNKITFIVQNAGVRIHHFPYALYLAGMDSSLEHVVFHRIDRRRYLRKCFTYEDALELLRTPSYSPSGEEYTKPYLRKPPRPLDEKELLLYAELRYFQRARGSYGFGYSNAVITSIKWTPEAGSFNVSVHTGYRYCLTNLASIQSLLGLRDTINSFGWSRTESGPRGVCRLSDPEIAL